MTDRRRFWGAVLVAALLLTRSPAGAGSATPACCLCDCAVDVCEVSFDCAAACLMLDCSVAGNQVCAVGDFAGCDGSCGAICNTPVPTPSSTAIISTPAPAGAPASSPRGLAIGVGMLALIAALALRRRRI